MVSAKAIYRYKYKRPSVHNRDRSHNGAKAGETRSHISEISQALLHHLLFFLVELRAIALDEFPEHKNDQRVKIFESPCEPGFRLLAQLLW